MEDNILDNIGFTIVIHYSTGDSFKIYDTKNDIGHIWSNLEIVKENLQRIVEFCKYLKYCDLYKGKLYRMKNKDVEWVENKRKEMKHDYIIEDTAYGVNMFYIKLKTDNGNEFQLYPFWTGHFEQVKYATIELRCKNCDDLDDFRVDLSHFPNLYM